MIPVLSVIALVLGTPIAIQQKTSTDFSGTWVLNKQASEGLSPVTIGADSVTWTISQDQKTISISEAMVGGPRPSTGSLGAYTLDGVERQSDSGGGPVVVTLRGLWAGPRLQLFRKQSVTGANPTETNALRILELSADGKTLTVAMRYQGSRGATESKWVFGR